NYIELGNATEAARRAGYKQPHVQGAQNLDKLRVQEYIRKRTEPTEKKRIASGDEVLQFFTRVMNGEEKDAFGLDASLDTKIKAAVELAKRTCDIKDSKTDGGITIINNIPKPNTAD
ncbi:MAG: terminase small subunit, partial [Lachnospiraceae bacterium]|nr:terminase small subunit [Lachnospiraceae bacterium]